MLLEDSDGERRFEVEVQLGATDESHIIRTIEYWDIERRHHPRYEHTAVIIAEDITSRFLNVIGLFNRSIPIMALQLSAIQTPQGIGLHFAKVLDTAHFAAIEEKPQETVDRNFWELKKGTPETVELADQILSIARELAPRITERFNRDYIRIYRDGRPCDFAWLIPQKKRLQLSIRLPHTDEIQERINSSGIEDKGYYGPERAYRLKLQTGDVAKHHSMLRELLKLALDSSTSLQSSE